MITVTIGGTFDKFEMINQLWGDICSSIKWPSSGHIPN